ncbi:3-deoxy-D-manno-octulosonic acid transferase [Mesonia sp. HuA40]|uniref:3-deoxy-D-manno-octulosonic acid transferase n=1 Tax=Mesonia sp. HuA40 TaxID=2602761 RepID=UPI0011CBB0EE|nr:glycosyltransferase N-terminal domain-containing protein [Mesonia sp. HuA40]TXK73914.1 3-deoxy-D-manno-octulosonic acid transferase [Mesonia sp. HuA40]
MKFLYDLFIHILQSLLTVLAWVSPKMKLFVSGRKNLLRKLEHTIPQKKNKRLWLHAASLGEYEQALPIIRALKEKNPNLEIIVSFFSPSGYEIRKNNEWAICTTYLPLDTPKNAKAFLKIVNPDLILFVKYEIWPNYLKVIAKNDLPCYLISAVFRKNHFLFTKFGQFIRKALNSFNHIFVQDQNSLNVLNANGFLNASWAGDTRYDRVIQQLQQDNHLPIIKSFKKNHKLLVAGSTWPTDEKVILSSLNELPKDLKIIIAPHQVDENHIRKIESMLNVSYRRYSQIDLKSDFDFKLLIIDNIGILSRIYAYADLAYVGGALGETGLHNILEPAVFGVPICIGPNYHKYPEANLFKAAGALQIIENTTDFKKTINRMTSDEIYHKKLSEKTQNIVNQQAGATIRILNKIGQHLKR